MAVLSQARLARRDEPAARRRSTGSTSSATMQAGLRIGLQLDAGWGLRGRARGARRGRGRGARVRGAPARSSSRCAPFSTRAMVDGIDRFWRMRSWLDLQGAAARAARQGAAVHRAPGSSGARGLARRGRVPTATARWRAMRDAAVAACQPFDFVLSPVSPVPTFAAEWASPTERSGAAVRAHRLHAAVQHERAAGRCRSTAGYTADGLPIGLQIIGRRHDDLGVLRVARAWEQMRPPQRPWPTF